MKFKELKKQSVTQLEKLLSQHKDELRDLRFKIANKQLKDVMQIRKTKRQIAQILTLLNQKKNT